MDFPSQAESLLKDGNLGHLDRQAVRPQRRHRLDGQVFESNGVAPVEAPGRPAQQGEHAYGPLEWGRQRDGGEAPEADVDPGGLIRGQLLSRQVLDRDDLVVVQRLT